MNLLSSFFSHPLMLIGLLGAAIPIIIEWLLRRRKQQTVLPTLRFLLKKEDENKIKRQDRWLLILRCVACFLIALATARPMLSASKSRIDASHIVLLLDNTASMQQSVGVTTAFAEARKKSAELLRQLPAGTAVSIVALSEKPEVVAENSREPLGCANKLEAMHPGEGAAPISDGLQAVSELLQRCGSPPADIYVLSDFQKSTWVRDSNEASRVKSRVGELTAVGTVNLIDCTEAPEFNDAVVKLAPSDPLATTGAPVTFEAEIHRFGVASNDQATTASFYIDGIRKQVREYHGSGKLEFNCRFTEPGEHLIEVQLEGDRFTLDNRRSYLADVPESRGVLLLDPTTNNKGLARRSFFLERAIAPPVDAGFDRVSPFSTKVADLARAAYENLQEYTAVALLNCETIDDAFSARLSAYVQRGGAVWIFLGPGFNSYDYNRRLFHDGTGLLPCRLSAPVLGAGELSIESRGLTFFSAQKTQLHAALTGYVPLEDQPQSTSEGIGSITRSGSKNAATPAIMIRPFGRGHVAVCAISPDLAWSSAPATAEFALLTQSVLRSLAGQPDISCNLQTGDIFEQPVLVSAQHLLLQNPAGKYERLTPEKAGDGWRVRYGPISQHGVYNAKTVKEILTRRRFVVNLRVDESDLSKLPLEDLRQIAGANCSYIGPRESWVENAGQRHAVTEFAPVVLWAFLLVLLTELTLAKRFGLRRVVKKKEDLA